MDDSSMGDLPLKFEPDVVDFILEFGPRVCASVEECRATLSSVGINKITPSAVARIMNGMLKATEVISSNTSNSGWIEDLKSDSEEGSWNGRVFVEAVLNLMPTFIWKEVFHQLDFPGFGIKSSLSFRCLIEALRYGLTLQGQTRPDQFPVEAFYRIWNNADAQINLIKCALNPANYDVFCFADFPYHSASVDILKNTGDKGHELKEVSTWKSLELVEVLLRLSDLGHFPIALELFQFPIQHCPDILIIALIQLTTPMNLLRQELMTTLLPIFFGTHVSSGAILQFAWQHSGAIAIRPILIHAMGDWYLRSDFDQARLSRILDIAQDLKALPLLLSSKSHPFVIDLACLASRREFLKLDKWLGDKIREHGEPFISVLVNVLKRRAPQLLGKEELGQTKNQLPPEVVAILINCLHQTMGKTSTELSETIMNLGNNYTILMSKQRQLPTPQTRLGNVLRSHRSMEPNFNSPPPPGQPPFQNDGLSNLGPTLAGLNLAGVGSYGLSGLNSIGGPTPGSPSRLLGHNFTQSPQQSSAFGGLQGPLVPPNRNASTPPITQTLGNPSLMGILSGRFGNPTQTPPVPTTQQQSIITENRRPNHQPDNNIGFSLGPLGTQTFSEIQGTEISKEAEDEANGYFHRIYSKPPDPCMSIDEVLELLKRFQDSSNRREREVFACMLRNLFEEYKFFPQYPEKELHTTAQLFGGIIEHGLVSSFVQLGIALRFVMDALKKPIGTKMYYFGVAALDRFKTKLKDYPQYCQHLKGIPHFLEFPNSLQEYVEYGIRQTDPPNFQRQRPSTNSLPVPPPSSNQTLLNQPPPQQSITSPASAPGQGKPLTAITAASLTLKGPSLTGRPSLANAANINTLLVAIEKDDKVIPPPEIIQDKTAFIFNNLNQMNLIEKCKELKELLQAEHWIWMSQYLVMKRASIELNFHTLYSNLLDTLKLQELNGAVLKETHRNIRILLRTDKSASNFSDRSLLKNLGHWLGMITVMKNRPIVLDDLDIKSLVIEAYRKGIHDLLYVVPFAAKIMESCARSSVFKPPCPWTMSILKVLAELHKEPDMKLNLKFEIEVLCKALSLEISDLKPSIILKDEENCKILVKQLSYTQRPIEPEKRQNSISLSDTQQPKNSQQRGTPGLDDFSSAMSTPPLLPSGGLGLAPLVSQTHQFGGPIVSGLSAIVPPAVAPDPRFSFMEVDTGNLSGLMTHVTINNQIPLLHSHPTLRQHVRPAIEKGITELVSPVVDRSVRYTVSACEAVIKKDFAMDSDELRIRNGAHQMMRYLTSGMAMITSRDHIFIAVSTNLKTAFTKAMRVAPNNQQIMDMIEQASNAIAQDNMEIACVFIQKTAVEKALVEIDKRLAAEYEVRKQAKMEGRRFCDPVMLAYQSERVPEAIRIKSSGINQIQLGVYEDFSRHIPGFLPLTDTEITYVNTKTRGESGQQQPPVITNTPATNHPPPLTNEDILVIYDKLIGQIDNYLQDLSLSSSPLSNQLSTGVRILGELIMTAKATRSVVSAITLLQKAVEGLLEGLASFPTDPEIIRFRDAHLLVLKALQDPRAFGEGWVNRQVTKILIEARSDLKFNVEAVDTLIRSNLINMLQFDAYLAGAIDKGNNHAAMSFAIPLVRMYCVDERFNVAINEGDFIHTADMLCRCATNVRQQHPEGLLSLVEALRGGTPGNQPPPPPPQPQPPSQQQQQQQQPMDSSNFLADRSASGGSAHLHTGINQAREFDDPSGLGEKAELLLREWIRLFVTQGTPRDSSKPFAAFINELNVSGILKSDDVITRFFRISVQCCANQVYQALQSGGIAYVRGKVYQSTDALVRLVALLIRHIGDGGNLAPKINLLNKFLGILAGLLIQDHDMQKTDFQQLPFHRMFIMLFYDVMGNDAVFESIAMQTLIGYSNTLHIVNPSKVPGFAYAWLEIVGNRVFIARMLALASDQKCWAMYCQLILDLFKFLQPFMRNADMPIPVQTLYRGTLRILLVILHDFPDFLCDYAYNFLDAIPPNCIQMRNLVLSAFPRNMRLPDPFTANLKVEMLADTALAPRILSNVAGMITLNFRKDIDSYLKTRAPVTFLSELRTNLQVQAFNDHGNRYNIPLINALVLYVGSQHIGVIRGRGQSPTLSTVAHTSHMDIFQNLAVDLDTEGRYLFLNALVNQLRFPSSHTHYFSLIILYLFAQSNTEVVQEQITRVLLERLVVNRPHPWGLLVTFIELIKNPAYKFWTHEFVHCAPEVEKLFESVARSCMVTKAPTMSSPPQVGGGSVLPHPTQSMTGLHLGSTTTNGPSAINFNTSSDSSLLETE